MFKTHQRVTLSLSNRIQFNYYKYLPFSHFWSAMDPEHLLSNLAIAFETSDLKKSENLVKRIIQLAASKLNPSKKLKSQPVLQASESISFIRKILNEKANHGRTKLISKAKLRRIAIKRVAHKNRKVHEQFVRNAQQKQFKIDHKKTQAANLCLCSFEKQEHKLQSGDQESQNFSLYPQNTLSRNLLKKVKTEQGGKEIISVKKLVQKKLKKTRKNFQSYLKLNENESKTDQITCPVCIEVLVDPITTICGHSFCFRCIDQSLLFGSTCPVCRLQIKGTEILSCAYIKDLIEAKLSQFLEDQNAIETYKLRNNQNHQWRKERFLDPSKIQQGDNIDVRDTEHIWCKAKIIKIFKSNAKIDSILIHYQQWAKIYDQIIDVNSHRLAPKQFFSSRTDIPRYNLGNEEENLRGAVITGNNNQTQSLRSTNSELNLSNIMNLTNLRNRFSSLHNNVVNELFPVSFLQRNRQVEFLHQVIESDSDNHGEFLRPNWIGVNEPHIQVDRDNDSMNSSSSLQVISVDEQEPENFSDQSGMAHQGGQSGDGDDYLSINNLSDEDDSPQEVDFDLYWNARPVIQLDDNQEYEEQSSEYMEVLRPSIGRISQIQDNGADMDEYSYQNISDSY